MLASSGGGGASASTGDMTGYYVVASPPDNIVFKPTYTVMPTDFTVVGTFQGFTEKHRASYNRSNVQESDGSYVADDTTISQDTFLQAVLLQMENGHCGAQLSTVSEKCRLRT